MISKTVSIAVGAMLASCPLVAEEIIVPAYDVATNDVPADAVAVQDGEVFVDGEGTLYKTGDGVWKIPAAMLPSLWTMPIAVDDGTLTLDFTDATTPPASRTLPASITDKALLWVDVNDPEPSHIASSGDVSVWYDRREGADVTTPKYCRASHDTSRSSAAPTRVALAGNVSGVYFGGYGSGRTMQWLLPSGSRFDGHLYNNRVCHVFAVHSVSNTWGTLFGTYTDYPTAFMTGGSKPGESHYWTSSSTWPAMVNGRTHVDGERIDGTMTTVGTGLHLLEAEPYHNVSCVSAGFFAAKSSGGCGGDSICEVMVFTNLLSETERVEVTAYLLKKWGLAANRPHVLASVRKGAELKIDTGSECASNRYVSLTGTGSVVKDGSGDWTIKNTKTSSFDGTLSINDGSVTMCSPVAVEVSAGKKLTVENEAAGPRVTVETDSVGRFDKCGGDAIETVGSLAGVNVLKVSGGTLSVRGARDGVAEEDILTPIPVVNGGFEGFLPLFDEKLSDGDGVLSQDFVTSKDGLGWDHVWNYSAVVKVVKPSRWTGISSGMDNASRTAFNITSLPPEGECALLFRYSGIVRSSPIALTAGLHELRFKMCGRQNSSYLGQVLRATIVGGSDSTERAVWGEVMFTHLNEYVDVRLRTTVAADGNYRLQFKAIATISQGLILLDDVRLYKVTPSRVTAATWKIPGGDMESTNYFGSSFSVDNVHTNWTFTQSSTWTDEAIAQVGVSTICTMHDGSGHGNGVFFNDSRRPRTGAMELCFVRSGTQASTTFTPPAGRWQLQCDIALLASHGVNPILTGYAKVGDAEEVSLGQLRPKTHLMPTKTFPTPFTADGETPVTIRLVASDIIEASSTAYNGILADDFMLVSANGGNLLSGGSCEGVNGSWWLKGVDATAFGGIAGIVRTRSPLESPAHFGTETVDGKYMVTIENLSCIYEDVYLPFPGRYRYSFYAHSRLIGKDEAYGVNPLRAWVAANGVTNVIGYADTWNSDWVQRTFDFDITEPGTYRVALQGCENPAKATTLREAHVDAISLTQISGERDRTPPFDANCRIIVDEGARLKTDFTGTNTVRGLRLGGVPLRGIVRVEDHPEYLSGSGTFNVVPHGSLIILR